MAKPMTDSQLLKALEAEGCDVREWAGWQTRGRPQTWGPINGVMVHHTGSDSQSNDYVKNILRDGYSGLPGPLCQTGIKMDGSVHLLSNGRANHAGGGDPAVLSAAINESSWLMDREAKPRRGNRNGVDGNARFYGTEVMYDGGQPMTAAQEDATVRFCAAICRFYGWSARSVIGHREWSSDKIDPGKESMVTLRRKIQKRLDGKASDGDKPAKAEPKGKVSLQVVTNDDVEHVSKALVERGFTKGTFQERYAAYQRSLGYSGRDADGVPGSSSLESLGFTVDTGAVINDPVKVEPKPQPTESVPPPKPAPEVPAVATDTPASDADILKALAKKGFKKGTPRERYAAYQRSLGYSGKGADGIPGKTSMGKLGLTLGPAPKSPKGYVRPIDYRSDTTISQGWNVRNSRYKSGRHNGVDIRGWYGEPILATMGGVVVRYYNDTWLGKRLIIKGDDGLWWSYAHTQEATVKKGWRVVTGEVIAKVGATGKGVTGPHLCMEAYPRSSMRYNTDLNPNRWP